MFVPQRALQLPAGPSRVGCCRSATIARHSISTASRLQAFAQRGYARSSRRQDDDDDDDEVGWWEKPNTNADSNPLDALSPWQTRRLEEAYAVGRRKVQVSALAKELDVDRSIITEWFKRFSKLPESEQAAIVSERRRELEWEETRAKAKAAAAAEGQRGAKGKADQADAPQEGFIPFKVWKTQQRDKKLRQDVLRTLEMVYERSPFPSDDVIRSLWDLHKIPRSTAIEWFKAKRKDAQGMDEQAPAEPAATEQPRTTPRSKEAKQEAALRKAAAATPEAAVSSSRAGSEPAATSAAAAAAAASRSAGQPTTSKPTATAAQAATAKPKKKGRFDDVKIVVTDEIDPSKEEQLQAAPPTADETMENLVMSYGELLVKAAQKDSVDSVMGAGEQPDSWADAWRWHMQRKGATRWKPLNWSAWLEQLSYTTDGDIDEELLQLDSRLE